MLTIELSEFMIELKDGAIKNVGPPNKDATVKLYNVEEASAREFGDKRVKLEFEDGEGNEIEVALFPEQVRALAEDVETLEAESPIFE